MNTTRTDPNLITSISDGKNYDAWCNFEAWYAPIICSFCVSRGMRMQDADDIAQEVFLRISQSTIATRYDQQKGRFRSYLFQVTRSAVSATMQRHPSPQSLESFADRASIDEWDKAWNKECARRALEYVERTTSVNFKQILNLSMRGMSSAVIAETMGVSIDSVYKARQRLHARIENVKRQYQLEE